MSTERCDAGKHFYDKSKHSVCPYCGVKDFTSKNFSTTKAEKAHGGNGGNGGTRTEPAYADSGSFRPSRVDNSGTPGMTRGIFEKERGVDPVVGWLVCVRGPNAGRDYRLRAGRNLVGRNPKMDVCIEGDDTISRDHHCEVVFSPRNKTFSLAQGTGRNLIYLNGEDVLTATTLQAQDQVEMGDSTFIFVPFCNDSFDWSSWIEPKRREKTAEADTLRE